MKVEGIKQEPVDLGTTIEMRPPITCRTATPLECMAILEEIADELERIGSDPTASEGYNLACKDNARIVREWLGDDFDLRRLCKKGRYCGQVEGHSGECDDIPF